MSANQKTLSFRISFPDGTRREESFEQSSVKIGSAATCHLQIEHPSVSRLHAVIEATAAGEVIIRDLGSKLGTFVNEKKIAPRAKLSSGSRLRLGEVNIDFFDGPLGASAQPAVAAPAAPSVPAAAAAPKAAAQTAPKAAPLAPKAPPAAPANPAASVDKFAAAAAAAAAAKKKAAQKRNPFAPPPVETSAPSTPLVKLDPKEIDSDVCQIEVSVLWGEDTVLHIEHLDKEETFVVGGGSIDNVVDKKEKDRFNYIIGAEALGLLEYPVVVREAGQTWVVIPEGATGEQIMGGHATPLTALPLQSSAALPGAQQVALEEDATIRIQHRDFVFVVKEVKAAKVIPTGVEIDWGFFAYLGGALLFFLLAALIVYFRPPDGGALSGQGLDMNNRLIQFAIEAAEQVIEEPEPMESGDPGEASAGDEGAMGKPDEAKTDRRFGVEGTASETQLARSEMKEMAASTAVAGILASLSGSFNAPTSPYGGDTAIGSDPMSAIGNMTGSAIGTSGGFGGLGMSGTGGGGGGFGLGTIGMGNMGTVGAAGVGRTGNLQRRTGAVPKMTSGAIESRGSLDKELIRRVVRRNESQVRFCYEQALHSNPDLRGRVEIRFLIAPTGAVQSAVVAKTEVGNQVGNCIAQAVRRWTFPAPEGGGIVSVTYPWTFSSGG